MLAAMPIHLVSFPALLPETTAFLAVTTPADAALARAARRSEEPFTFAAFVRQGDAMLRIGCAAVVIEVVVEHGQLLGVRARGLARVELTGPISAAAPLPRAEVRVLDAPAPADPLLRAQLARVATRLYSLPIDPSSRATLTTIDEPGRFADLLAAQLEDLTLEQRMQLLTTTDPTHRLTLIETLLAPRTTAPTREFARVWAALREPSSAIPSHASLRARAGAIDTAALRDLQLRHTVDEFARAQPILVVEVDDSRELEARRESLSQLTSAVRSLTSLRACGDPDDPEDAGVQAEIAASIAFLLTVAANERAEISRGR